MLRRAALAPAALLIALAAPAPAQEIVSHALDRPYEDVLLDLQLAIEGRGLKIDAVSHVGEMLNRTAADVGATVQVYDHAEVTQFCSATVSRQAMEADPLNIAFCPYAIFTYRLHAGETVVIGWRRMDGTGMEVVNDLLAAIVTEVVEGGF